MRFANAPRLLHAGREEREAKLRDFVAADLNAAIGSGALQGAGYSLLARAPDSPVARALALLAADFAAASMPVRALLLDLDGLSEDQTRKTLLDMANVEIRLLSDPRFAAAHEQLVLSSNRMWIGDCMRRDPAKRDALELFHDDNVTASKHAAISFERMWAVAKPVRRVSPIASDFVMASQQTSETPGLIAPRR